MRSLRVFLCFAALVSTLAVTGPSPTAAQVSPAAEVVALVIEGVGFGHGRGMSQWGAYGRAVNGAQSWQQILDAYYGGTTTSTVSTSSRVRVRLVGHDGATIVGVVSTSKRAMWAGTGYAALQARQTATPHRYDIYASGTAACPGSTTSGWTRIAAGVAAPVTFTTTVNELSGAPGDVLGVCRAGAVVHYRGSIQLTRDSAGASRVVNDVLAEAYLRGVVSREVSTSWGNAGGGAGMNSLRAQAVAARSYALASNRYASSGGYATTCDTTACQAYGGSARRDAPTGGLTSQGTCESGNLTFECANTNRAIAETAGRVRRGSDGPIAVTEFSASNGPRTAGGTFPAINDPFDDVPSNPNHRWTRIIDADQLEVAYGLGTMTAARTEPDPAAPFDGVWDNRVRLTGTTSSVVIGALSLRSAFGLPSHGFTVRAVTRGVQASTSMRFIGDSVGRSMTETSTSELPALLDGVFTSASYDAAQNRCTSGCGLSGVGAAASVPIGTDLVLVELGYNTPTTDFGTRVDAMMSALQARQVERVVWVNLSERSGSADYVAANQALSAARTRWPDLYVLDWKTASAGNTGNRSRWFTSDGIHLTLTGQAEMARFVRDRLIPLADFPIGSSIFAWDRETGRWAVRSMTDFQFRLRSEGQWTVGYDEVVAGDFDRDGDVDDLFIWDRDTGNWVVQSISGYTPVYKFGGRWARGYDQVIVGDLDGDGLVNDMFVWDNDTGLWVVQSFAGLRPTFRSTGTYNRAYDTMVVGDLDGDGRLDDTLLWDTTSGFWVVQSFVGFRPTYRGTGTWTAVYDLAYAGDWDGDGRGDDLAVWDDDTGNIAVQSWSSFRPIYRGRATFSSTIDLVAGADLDDDENLNEMLVFDMDANAWQVHRWQQFRPTLARAGTWPDSYDVILEVSGD